LRTAGNYAAFLGQFFRFLFFRFLCCIGIYKEIFSMSAQKNFSLATSAYVITGKLEPYLKSMIQYDVHMDLLLTFYAAAAVLFVLLTLFIITLLILSCFHILRNHRLAWKSSVSSSNLVPRSLDMIDVDRIISRRQERIAESVEKTNKNEDRTNPLEHIDNDTATVLAVDQLLDTSFLISDEELACYAPPVDMKIVAARRDHCGDDYYENAKM
uniref:Bm4235 n=1 Tax=Onchocerca flexuosa TaxID=387005 RepID=A0A183H860_9BILA